MTARAVRAPLHAIVDVDVATHAGWAPDDLASAFLDGGASVIQIRAKHLASGAFLQLCDRVVARATPYGASVIVNDRGDLARMAGAAGVHVGQEDLDPTAARALVGSDAIVGVSTHTIDQVVAAVPEPVDYIAVGPVFGTRTKDTGYEAVGLDLVASAARQAAARPIVGIGGITLATAPTVIAAGATAVAVIGDLVRDDHPSRRVAAYLRAISRI